MKTKKTERQKAVNHADDWMSKYVRKRDSRCVTCGSTERLQCGHLITRAKYSTRWNVFNAFCQCASCNMRHEYQPEHLTNWFIKQFGVKAYDWLIQVSNKPTKYTDDEIREFGNNFKELAE